MEFFARLPRLIALFAVFGGILAHSQPAVETEVLPRQDTRPTVGRLTADRYAALQRIYNGATEPKDAEVKSNTVNPPEPTPAALPGVPVDESNKPSASSVPTPAAEATASPNVDQTAKLTTGDQKTEWYSAMGNLNTDEREKASLFKELPFAKRKEVSFQLPSGDASNPKPSEGAYAPANEVPLGYAYGTTLPNDADKPKAHGALLKNVNGPSVAPAEPLICTPATPTSKTPTEILQTAESEKIVPDTPVASEGAYAPANEVPLAYASGTTLTNEADKPKIVGATLKRDVVNRSNEVPAAPARREEPLYDEVAPDYRVKRRPAPPIPTGGASAAADLCKETSGKGAVSINKDTSAGAVPERVPVYRTLKCNLRSLPEVPREAEKPVYALLDEKTFDSMNMHRYPRGYNPPNKDNKSPNAEPLYDVVPFDIVAEVETPPCVDSSNGRDRPNIGRPLPNSYQGAAVSGANSDEIVSDPDTREKPAKRTESFTEHFNEGVDKASHGIKAGFKSIGSYASKKAKATKNGILKVGSVVGCALTAAGDCGKYFLLQVRRTTGDALARLYATVVPKH